jgi:lipoate-protein ligase A
MNTVITSVSTDPWHNLALEELLFTSGGEGTVLYLWQNRNTVVIGRNQNAWKECRADLLEREGGRLARRTSGGGAVFHDMGNLNFTFITPRGGYDLERQLGVILGAVRSQGIDAGFTGRNDLVTAGGGKFSGNAFCFSRDRGLHHGTILVDVDMDKLSRYLVPSADKLRSKGVDSVRSRVANLRELNPDITIDSMAAAVEAAFKAEYGECVRIGEASLDRRVLSELEARHASWEWRMGKTPEFDVQFDARFSWGGVELCFRIKDGTILDATAYSDAMDEAFIRSLPGILKGRRFNAHEMGALSLSENPMLADIGGWLEGIGS